MKPKITDYTIEEINAMNLQQLLKGWRFSPIGYFNDSPQATAWTQRMFDLRQEDPQAWVTASKEIGWS